MQHDARIGAPLRQDCQAAIGFRSRFGHYALCHLALEHQRQRLPERRPLRRRQPTHQKLGADVVRQIGGNADRRHQVLPGVDLQRIAVDHLELAGIARPDLGQRRQAARVLFDRQHLARPLGQQAPGQPAGAGADLEHVAEALGGDVGDRCALALEHRIGGDGGADAQRAGRHGTRAGAGQAAHRFDRGDTASQPQQQQAPKPVRQPVVLRAGDNRAPANEAGVRAIAAADPGFDLLGFLEGAKGAYGMILEAFWKGDKDTLRELTDDDVYESFAQAIEAREEAGETLDNRLIRIEDATVRSAELDGSTARIAVLFVADIAAVTRDADGTVVAGSLDDAIESRDVWTFRRNVGAADPNWVLDETDEG